MQGLAHYNDSPSPPHAHHRNGSSSQSRSGVDQPGSSATPVKRRKLSPQHQSAPPADAVAGRSTRRQVEQASLSSLRFPKSGGKGKERESPNRLEADLAHTSQADLPLSELAKGAVAKDEREAMRSGMPDYTGLSEDEVFRLVTRPEPIERLAEWGIPQAVDPSLCSPQLSAKVAQFLKLKYDNNQHINTSLLQSTSFHNPHIYSKLVEFVDLSERKSHFPSGGWLTRIDIEDEIAEYGPAAMAVEQKRKQEEVKRSQEVGKRSNIAFTAGREGDKKEKRGWDDRDRRSGERKRDRERGRERDGRRDRERDRAGPNGRYGDTLGLSRDRDGGWDERDMKKEKPRYRYY